MNIKPLLLYGLLLLAMSERLPAQIRLKLEPLPATDTWGVYARACTDITPSSNAITGSGQITVVYPIAMTMSNYTQVAGNWMLNAVITGPDEAPGSVYASYGFQFDNPHILYFNNYETLLFSFKLTGNAAWVPHLIENGVDPFDQLPNSENSNPGNELSVVDFANGIYNYTGNYTGATLDCYATEPVDTTEEPQDTTIIEEPLDTTDLDTTIIEEPLDTMDTDTTIIEEPQDTSGVDTTIIKNPEDTTENETTAVQETSATKRFFTISPNPASEQVTVRFHDAARTQGGQLCLYNAAGVPIQNMEKGQNNTITVNIGELPAGLYYLSFVKKGKVMQRERMMKH